MRQTHEPLNIAESLTPGEQRRLQKAVAIKVYELDSDVWDQRKRFKEIYHDVKHRFAVSSYKEINPDDLQEAIRFIEGWYPVNF